MYFKANIIKLEKGIVYQPLEVDNKILQKSKRYSGMIYFDISFGKKYGVCYRSNPTLKTQYIFLGFEYCGTGYSTTLRFSSNDERDRFHDDLVKAIKASIEKLKYD